MDLPDGAEGFYKGRRRRGLYNYLHAQYAFRKIVRSTFSVRIQMLYTEEYRCVIQERRPLANDGAVPRVPPARVDSVRACAT